MNNEQEPRVKIITIKAAQPPEAIKLRVADYVRVSSASDDQLNSSVIRYILHNEKYFGDTLLRKNYRTDSFPYERRRNKGECTQYYVSNTQEQIICIW